MPLYYTKRNIKKPFEPHPNTNANIFLHWSICRCHFSALAVCFCKRSSISAEKVTLIGSPYFTDRNVLHQFYLKIVSSSTHLVPTSYICSLSLSGIAIFFLLILFRCTSVLYMTCYFSLKFEIFSS